ncbi:MFS transporter [Ruegeria sp. A3M17]|uniref:MFS transporter n=1 Tax=Ruegeria sp. A3M17 TaxID=2267229 RepID=UPI000DE8F466|nr:MFS transporter [Ruegeria sp. A3M17]RBW60455.1 MFS transporter [Ruegeria sp. A3M17]
MQTVKLSPRSVVAATSGNTLEWYDFTVYGFLAPIIGRVFFPSDDPFAATISAFAVLAIGYAARAIGSFVFGHIGDRLGRKPALILSVLLMGGGSLAIACLPTYEQIGISAAVLLVAIRIMQGISVAGEYTASGVLIIEQTPLERRGFIGSFVPFAMLMGCVLGSAVPAALSSILSDDQMAVWGWRVPFLLGAVVALFSVILRRNLSESTAMSEVSKSDSSPVIVALSQHWHLVMQMVILLIPTAVIYFMIFVYAASYLTAQMHITSAKALDITTLNLLVMALAAPLFGWLADRFGLRPVFLAAAIASVVFAVPLWGLMHQNALVLIYLGQLGLALINGVAWALSVTALTSMAPSGLRVSTVALGYNICMAIFGGTTALIATYLVNRTGDDFAPAYYMIAAALLSIPVIWRLPKLIVAAQTKLPER